MFRPDTYDSLIFMKMLAATLGVLLIVSNVMWFIAYNTAASPLAKPTVKPTLITPSPTPIGTTPTPTL